VTLSTPLTAVVLFAIRGVKETAKAKRPVATDRDLESRDELG
jgi:hypothetical protein